MMNEIEWADLEDRDACRHPDHDQEPGTACPDCGAVFFEMPDHPGVYKYTSEVIDPEDLTDEDFAAWVQTDKGKAWQAAEQAEEIRCALTEATEEINIDDVTGRPLEAPKPKPVFGGRTRRHRRAL